MNSFAAVVCQALHTGTFAALSYNAFLSFIGLVTAGRSVESAGSQPLVSYCRFIRLAV